jgi:hypothetical protein
MKFFVSGMIGFGAGLVVAGIVAAATPFLNEPVRNIGIIGLGGGLFVGGVVAAIILRTQKRP